MSRAVCFAIGLAVGVIAALVFLKDVFTVRPVGERPQGARSGVTVYLPAEKAGEPELQPAILPRAPASPDRKHRAEAVIAALLHPGKGRRSPLPEGTRLRSLAIQGDMAVFDFSQDLAANFPGGSEWESVVVSSIVRSLTHIEGIRKVQILVEGEKVESLGGHIEISEPLTPEMVAPSRP